MRSRSGFAHLSLVERKLKGEVIYMDKNVLWEAVKEPLRLLVLAIIPFGIAYFSNQNYELAVVGTVVLRFIDKFLWELGQSKPKQTSVIDGGLTRF
jgi:hypothetical protein